jgi:predicted aspartyl protease
MFADSGTQLFLSVSIAAVSGLPTPRTLCLHGCIQGKQVHILVDSGSSHTFISRHLASQLQGVTTMPAAITVQVANGSTLQCTSHMQQASWSVADYQFITDLKVLPLSSYDMILGLDWLESFSPMKIDWKKEVDIYSL